MTTHSTNTAIVRIKNAQLLVFEISKAIIVGHPGMDPHTVRKVAVGRYVYESVITKAD